MRTPKFWYNQKNTIQSFILKPVSWIYGLARELIINHSKTWEAPIPIICVGNLVTGGQGKTPTALSICNALKHNNKIVHFISRGYRGANRGPLLVNPKSNTANEVGDEPLLLSEFAPTWVSANREAGIKRAYAMGAEIIVMDDGFQNPSVKKDLSIIVIDGEVGFGNGNLIPAGPLREEIANGLLRANFVVIIGKDIFSLKDTLTSLVSQTSPMPIKIYKAELKPNTNASLLNNEKVFAFTGIGRPEKFFNTLVDIGCNIIGKRDFADHHKYTEKEISNLLKIAKKENAKLVTTSKDYVRLNTSQQKNIIALPIKLHWSDSTALDSIIKPLI
ncbi:MAG: tetraacyldisaccharide 4'-kinase [Pseudomonadota bacterium]|nr:tetraacyldisaccharide 4'-kinase [Pseudomonadota bacterium]